MRFLYWHPQHSYFGGPFTCLVVSHWAPLLSLARFRRSVHWSWTCWILGRSTDSTVAFFLWGLFLRGSSDGWGGGKSWKSSKIRNDEWGYIDRIWTGILYISQQYTSTYDVWISFVLQPPPHRRLLSGWVFEKASFWPPASTRAHSPSLFIGVGHLKFQWRWVRWNRHIRW